MIIHIHGTLLLIRMTVNVLAVNFKHCNMTERGHANSLSDCCLALHSLIYAHLLLNA